MIMSLEDMAIEHRLRWFKQLLYLMVNINNLENGPSTYIINNIRSNTSYFKDFYLWNTHFDNWENTHSNFELDKYTSTLLIQLSTK